MKTWTRTVLASALLAAPLAFSSPALAQAPAIEASNLDAIVRDNPLPATGPTAKVVGTSRAGNSELQIIVMSRIKLHHHEQEDHVVYVARGQGTARLENASGKLDTRPVGVGDVLNLPRGKKHAFEKTGDENLVLLVVATAGWKPLEDTAFAE